ncbi:transposable element Tcb2 transposase [Trichonephila clavipes]|uniref:Transposable element Tcb2 transposase n=1 Tax=Trichonephila clavipes TaxID=2585209 RepID=A0A8X6RLK6_TRICX|nr:transposable element Tcb2 transposase [Trichonephila clavipes]
MVRIPTILNAIRYVEFLRDRLHPLMLFCYQQNKCTSHMSRSANGWLDEQTYDFSVIHWPPRCSDINPTKYLLDVSEQGVKDDHTAPTNLTEFWIAVANIRLGIPVERFQKFVQSMLRRGAAVIKS